MLRDSFTDFEEKYRQQRKISEQKRKIELAVVRHNKSVKQQREAQIQIFLKKHPDVSIGYDFDGSLIGCKTPKLEQTPLVRQIKAKFQSNSVTIQKPTEAEVQEVQIIEDEVKKLFMKLPTRISTQSSNQTGQSPKRTKMNKTHTAITSQSISIEDGLTVTEQKEQFIIRNFKPQQGVKVSIRDYVLPPPKKQKVQNLQDRVSRQDYDRYVNRASPQQKLEAKKRALSASGRRNIHGLINMMDNNHLVYDYSVSSSNPVTEQNLSMQQRLQDKDQIRVCNSKLFDQLL